LKSWGKKMYLKHGKPRVNYRPKTERNRANKAESDCSASNTEADAPPTSRHQTEFIRHKSFAKEYFWLLVVVARLCVRRCRKGNDTCVDQRKPPCRSNSALFGPACNRNGGLQALAVSGKDLNEEVCLHRHGNSLSRARAGGQIAGCWSGKLIPTAPLHRNLRRRRSSLTGQIAMLFEGIERCDGSGLAGNRYSRSSENESKFGPAGLLYRRITRRFRALTRLMTAPVSEDSRIYLAEKSARSVTTSRCRTRGRPARWRPSLN
jgi:hypothetical protein